MFILGLILFLLGFFFGVHILFVLGIVGMVIGGVLYLMSANGRGVGGRYWY